MFVYILNNKIKATFALLLYVRFLFSLSCPLDACAIFSHTSRPSQTPHLKLSCTKILLYRGPPLPALKVTSSTHKLYTASQAERYERAFTPPPHLPTSSAEQSSKPKRHSRARDYREPCPAIKSRIRGKQAVLPRTHLPPSPFPYTEKNNVQSSGISILPKLPLILHLQNHFSYQTRVKLNRVFFPRRLCQARSLDCGFASA